MIMFVLKTLALLIIIRGMWAFIRTQPELLLTGQGLLKVVITTTLKSQSVKLRLLGYLYWLLSVWMVYTPNPGTLIILTTVMVTLRWTVVIGKVSRIRRNTDLRYS